MNVVIATVATLFLMMPGFAFVAGVNISDKNIREIVFRGTPAELAYVVAISLFVHLALLLAFSFTPPHFIDQYGALLGIPGTPTLTPPAPIFKILLVSLLYFAASAVVGGLLGWCLGLAVRKRRWKYFIKHRWMVMLAGLSDADTVYAHAVITPSFPQGKDAQGVDYGNGATVIQGWVRDCFFNSDGTLLYLIFSSYKDSKVNLASDHWLASLDNGDASHHASSFNADQRLVLEGRQVAFVQYEPILVPPLSQVRKELQQLEHPLLTT